MKNVASASIGQIPLSGVIGTNGMGVQNVTGSAMSVS